MTKTNPHLNELNLELCRLGEGEPEDAAHLKDCAQCQARLEKLEALAAQVHFQMPELPAALDEAVFKLAADNAQRVKRTHKMRRSLLWAAPAVAAAAAFIMVALPGEMNAPTDPSPIELQKSGDAKTPDVTSPSPPTSVTRPESLLAELADEQGEGAGKPMAPADQAKKVTDTGDINGDGQMDILDAYAMARALKHGNADQPNWDQNGDGKVGAQDVRSLAQAAVALSEKNP